MNKAEYLCELRGRLSNRVSPQELESIIHYYEEYFDEAGPEREREVLGELGTPADLVKQIMGDQVIRDLERPKEKGERRRSGLGSVWTILLAILAAPIAIPVAFAIVITAVALVAAVLAVAVALGAAGVIAMVYGVFSAFCGFASILTHGLATTMYFMGGGMVTSGFGILLTVGAVFLGGLCLKGIARLFGRILVRRRGEPA